MNFICSCRAWRINVPVIYDGQECSYESWALWLTFVVLLCPGRGCLTNPKGLDHNQPWAPRYRPPPSICLFDPTPPPDLPPRGWTMSLSVYLAHLAGPVLFELHILWSRTLACAHWLTGKGGVEGGQWGCLITPDLQKPVKQELEKWSGIQSIQSRKASNASVMEDLSLIQA